MPRPKGSLNKHPKKEKHTHEKKKRGRPPKQQHQQQKQKQIVNVNVNTGGGGDGEKKSKELPQSLFNPSLITPTFNYANKDPINPPDINELNNENIMKQINDQLNSTTRPRPPPPEQQPVRPIAQPVEPIHVQPIQHEPIPQDQPQPPSTNMVQTITGTTAAHAQHLVHQANLQNEDRLNKLNKLDGLTGKFKYNGSALARNALYGVAAATGAGAASGSIAALIAGNAIGESALGGAIAGGAAHLGGMIGGDTGATIAQGVAHGTIQRMGKARGRPRKEPIPETPDRFEGLTGGRTVGKGPATKELAKGLKQQHSGEFFDTKPHEIKGVSSLEKIKKVFGDFHTKTSDTIELIKSQLKPPPSKGKYALLPEYDVEDVDSYFPIKKKTKELKTSQLQEDFSDFLNAQEIISDNHKERHDDITRQIKERKQGEAITPLQAAIKRTINPPNLIMHGKQYKELKDDQAWRNQMSAKLLQTLEPDYKASKLQAAIRAKLAKPKLAEKKAEKK